MRLSAAVANARPIQVGFAEGAVLSVTYRPSKATPADLDRIAAEQEAAEEANKKAGRGKNRISRAEVRQMVTSMAELLVSWDLTDDNDNPIDPTDPDALMDVPSHVFVSIMKAVGKDQTDPEADAPSDAG